MYNAYVFYSPVKQFRGKQKTEDDEDEPARDVRPDLIQAKDVLVSVLDFNLY